MHHHHKHSHSNSTSLADIGLPPSPPPKSPTQERHDHVYVLDIRTKDYEHREEIHNSWTELLDAHERNITNQSPNSTLGSDAPCYKCVSINKAHVLMLNQGFKYCTSKDKGCFTESMLAWPTSAWEPNATRSQRTAALSQLANIQANEMTHERNWSELASLPQEHLKGRVYVWESYSFAGNFAHWLFQFVPKIADFLYLRANVSEYEEAPVRQLIPWYQRSDYVEPPIRLAIPWYRQSAYVRELLTLFGLHQKHLLVTLEDRRHYVIDTLFASGTHNLGFNPAQSYTKWQERWTWQHLHLAFSQRLGGPEMAPRRRLYLMRSNSTARSTDNVNSQSAGEDPLRKIYNEPAMIDMLRSEYRFEVTEAVSMTLLEKAKALRNLDVFMTTAGSSVANLLFADPAPRVLVRIDVAAKFFTPEVSEYYRQMFYGGSKQIPTLRQVVIRAVRPKGQAQVVDLPGLREALNRELQGSVLMQH